jgi:hypothetical protein
MTPYQHDLCKALITNVDGTTQISNESFAAAFPDALEQNRLADRLLNGVVDAKSAEDLSCAMLVGFRFGFSVNQRSALAALIHEDWHQCHEDLVSVLQDMGGEETIEALFAATQHVPEYLEWDSNRALAVKAIYALDRLPYDEAKQKLKILANSLDPILSDLAGRSLALAQVQAARRAQS